LLGRVEGDSSEASASSNRKVLNSEHSLFLAPDICIYLFPTSFSSLNPGLVRSMLRLTWSCWFN